MLELADQTIEDLWTAINDRNFCLAKDIYDQYLQEKFDRNALSGNNGLSVSLALIEKGKIHIDNKIRETGETLLMRAISCRHIGVIRALLISGADINAKDKDGNSALTKIITKRNNAWDAWNVMKGNLVVSDHEILDVLFSYRPDIFSCNKFGESVIDFIIKNKNNIEENVFEKINEYYIASCESQCHLLNKSIRYSNGVNGDGKEQLLAF